MDSFGVGKNLGKPLGLTCIAYLCYLEVFKTIYVLIQDLNGMVSGVYNSNGLSVDKKVYQRLGLLIIQSIP